MALSPSTELSSQGQVFFQFTLFNCFMYHVNGIIKGINIQWRSGVQFHVSCEWDYQSLDQFSVLMHASYDIRVE